MLRCWGAELRALWLLAAPIAVLASTEEAARKVLSARCWACHAQTAMSGLRLDSREAMLRGGKSGAAVKPGSASASRLIRAVERSDPAVKPMPPGSALTVDELQSLRKWIDEGAPWREPGDHWSFQPLSKIRDGGIDRLINDTLRSKRIRANRRADKRTLIRRVYFDLIGLPPDEQEFVAAHGDSSPDWFARLVSKLLASPHFGEKWGRHWLDVARYGEDDFTGTQVMPYPEAWRYREWVVQAINQDMPYDRFLMAQIAGDLMDDPSLLPATGLFGLGPWYYGIAQPAQSRADERHDRVDMVTRGMLGVTVACARCHDHKYDPFTARDYYALAGVFSSTAYKEYPLVSEQEASAWTAAKRDVDKAEKALHLFLDEQARELAGQFASRIADFMMGASGSGTAEGLDAEIVERWKSYLAKPEEGHPFLRAWQSGKTAENAKAFESLIMVIHAEKKALDAQNKKLVEEAAARAPKVVRTIVLPGGYRSEEDFNPGAEVPAQSLERDRYVAWNRIFGEASSPLRLNRELTAKLLREDRKVRYDALKAAVDSRKKALAPKYAFLYGVGEFEPHDLQLNIRGNPEMLGELVPRRFPLALSAGRTVDLRDGSGRLQLARAVASHPLAARVAVNRIWMTLFGQGIVRTPSNFGAVGDRPSMPDLLEYLAGRFVAKKFSVKEMIREIVLSDAYQRASSSVAASEKADGENRYVWRQSRRRLAAEPLLDAMLSVSGELDRTVGGASKELNAEFRRRTLYAKTSRFQQDETLSLFDLPSAAVTCEQRVVTNVPLQKLFFLN